MASADMENVFIRKDVFDARMDRMEMLLEKNLTEVRAENEKFRSEMRAENEKFRSEMKAENEKFRSDMKTENEKFRSEMRAENEKFRSEIIGGNEKFHTEIRAEIKVLDERINSVGAKVDSMQTTISWGFAFLTIIIALVTFAPSLLDFRKKLRKPSVASVSIDEIQEMINSSIAKAMGMKQN